MSRKSKVHVCGWCAGAARTAGGADASHRRCRGGTEATPCACAQEGHRLTPALADHFARYCHLTVDEVYARHGRKRRVLTDEQKAAATARLVKARAARTAKVKESA